MRAIEYYFPRILAKSNLIEGPGLTLLVWGTDRERYTKLMVLTLSWDVTMFSSCKIPGLELWVAPKCCLSTLAASQNTRKHDQSRHAA
jgi:hypothetical protein